MSRMIFVNLPVADLGKSRGFLEALGATNEPKFTDDSAACMQLSDSIFVMLLTHDKFTKIIRLIALSLTTRVACFLKRLVIKSNHAVRKCN